MEDTEVQVEVEEEFYGADIAPAIHELKKVHRRLLDTSESPSLTPQLVKALSDRTVVSVVPKDRRVEEGWFHERAWEKKSDAVMQQLDPSAPKDKFYEIFISGEALSQSTENIVLLMLHQVLHQLTGVVSQGLYHGQWMRVAAQKYFGIPQEAWSRDEKTGWTNLDKKQLPGSVLVKLQEIVKAVDPGSFDMYRVKMVKDSDSKATLHKWNCGCNHPLRSSNPMVRLTCDKCGQKLKLWDPDKVPQKFVERIPQEYVRWKMSSSQTSGSTSSV